MNKLEIKKRIEKLRAEVNHYRYEYHVLDKSEISDAALDSLKNELFKFIKHAEQQMKFSLHLIFCKKKWSLKLNKVLNLLGKNS